MTFIWREREYEEIDRDTLGDALTLNTLPQCGLLKLFRVYNMRAEKGALQTII